MAAKVHAKSRRPAKKAPREKRSRDLRPRSELVIITGLSGSGKASALKAFEDLGYYCVDNLPVDLIPRFAELAVQSLETRRTALVVDVREGSKLEKLPAIVKSVRRLIPTMVIYLEATDASLIRRFSETRRPHPFGAHSPVRSALGAERRRLKPIRAIADWVVDTSKFNVHELRAHLTERFQKKSSDKNILVSCVSFGFKHGVPEDADLVFDVRFLPNPHFVASLRAKTGLEHEVKEYVLKNEETRGFLKRLYKLLDFTLPLYEREGKSSRAEKLFKRVLAIQEARPGTENSRLADAYANLERFYARHGKKRQSAEIAARANVVLARSALVGTKK